MVSAITGTPYMSTSPGSVRPVGELVQAAYDKMLEFQGMGRWPAQVPAQARVSTHYDAMGNHTMVGFTWDRGFGNYSAYRVDLPGYVGEETIESWRTRALEQSALYEEEQKRKRDNERALATKMYSNTPSPTKPQMAVCADCGMDTFDEIVDAASGADLCFYCKELRDLRAQHPAPKKKRWRRSTGFG